MLRAGLGILCVLLGILQAQGAHAGPHLGMIAGMHGGVLSHYSNGSVTDPVKEGIIGHTYGYQVGLDLGAGPLWVQVLYLGSSTRVTDYQSGLTPNPELRYMNRTLTVPILYAVTKNRLTLGIGAYYSHPLSIESQRDLGMVIAAKTRLGQKLFASLDWLGGFREQAQGGNNLQFLLNLGYSFK